jgi:uncharacterized membrane protein
MSGVWLAVAVVGTASILLRGAGPLVLGGRRLPDRAMALIGLLAPALLAALVATQAFSDGRRLVLDERALGLAAAGLALALRAPVLGVIAAAAAATAAGRALL